MYFDIIRYSLYLTSLMLVYLLTGPFILLNYCIVNITLRTPPPPIPPHPTHHLHPSPLSHCLICLPLTWCCGCTVPAPSGVLPDRSWGRWLFWFWPAYSETRFWSEIHWGPVPAPDPGVAALSGSGCSGTRPWVSGAAPPWRPCVVVCPPYLRFSSLVYEIWDLRMGMQ